MTVWKDFRPPYISEAMWTEYIQHVMSDCLVQQSHFGAENYNRRVHDSVTTPTSSFEVDGKILF
jgi:hypothetical protein